MTPENQKHFEKADGCLSDFLWHALQVKPQISGSDYAELRHEVDKLKKWLGRLVEKQESTPQQAGT